MGKKVAVIGAGSTGLVAIKNLLDEGHNVTCFERSSDIGGLWNYDLHSSEEAKTLGYQPLPANKDIPIHSSYDSLLLNTLTYGGLCSDFLPLEQQEVEKIPQYLTPSKYLDYFKEYVQNFDLRRFIKFGCHVTEVKKSDNPCGWMVYYQKEEPEIDIKHELFDFLFVASGEGCYSNFPKLPGCDDFKGLMIHSSQLRHESPVFAGKKVLVVGGKFSGGDMVMAALQNKAEHVYWIMSRKIGAISLCVDRYPVGDDGKKKPFFSYITRFNYQESGNQVVPIFLKYAVPITETSDPEPSKGGGLFVNDSQFFKKAVSDGKISFIPGISSFAKSGKEVNLMDDSTLEIDVVVFATGFIARYPFLDNIWPKEEQNVSFWYKSVINPQKELDGVAFIGMIRGPFNTQMVSEMQSRWLCKTILNKNYKEDHTLFDPDERKKMEESTAGMTPDRSVIDIFEYMDRLASDMDCCVPSFGDLLQEYGAELAVAVYHGPIIGSHYVLSDPNAPNIDQCKNYILWIAKIILGEEFDKLVQQYRK